MKQIGRSSNSSWVREYLPAADDTRGSFSHAIGHLVHGLQFYTDHGSIWFIFRVAFG